MLRPWTGFDARVRRSSASAERGAWCKGGRTHDTEGRHRVPAAACGESPVHDRPGAHGNLWFTESDRGTIGRITPSGTITEFPLEMAGQRAVRDHGRRGTATSGSRSGSGIRSEGSRPQGTITEYPHSHSRPPSPGTSPRLPNGDLWFTEENVDQVAVIPSGIWRELTSTRAARARCRRSSPPAPTATSGSLRSSATTSSGSIPTTPGIRLSSR